MMRFYRYLDIFIAVAIFAIGCKPPSSYEIQVENNVAPDELNQLKEAVADWEENAPALKVDIRPAHGGCAGLYACITVSVTGDYVEPDGSGPAGDIVVSRLVSHADMGHLLRHRLGHAFGLPHGAPNTVMDDNPKTWAWVVMPADAEAWRVLR